MLRIFILVLFLFIAACGGEDESVNDRSDEEQLSEINDNDSADYQNDEDSKDSVDTSSPTEGDEVSDEGQDTVPLSDDENDHESQGDVEPGHENSDEDSDESDSSNPSCFFNPVPTMDIAHKGMKISFSAKSGQSVMTTVVKGDVEIPEEWSGKTEVVLDTLGEFTIFAKIDGCDRIFRHVTEVRDEYPAAAEEPGSTAVDKGSKSIVGWATGVEKVTFGADVSDKWKDAKKALGVAKGDSFDIVSLGRGGSIVLSFDKPIRDGAGYDFAVFENSFSHFFLELGFIEVSTDGKHFIRFDTVYLAKEEVTEYGEHDPKTFYGFAGTYKQGFGTPFDLSVLRNKQMVIDGTVDLENIRFVKIIDIDGSGKEVDSFGNKVYDPFPTKDSVGFDLDAVGVINDAVN